MNWLEPLHCELLHGAGFGRLWSGLDHGPLGREKASQTVVTVVPLVAHATPSPRPMPTDSWKRQGSLVRNRPPFCSFSLPGLHRVPFRVITTLTLGAQLPV